jgi:hypothetical protein
MHRSTHIHMSIQSNIHRSKSTQSKHSYELLHAGWRWPVDGRWGLGVPISLRRSSKCWDSWTDGSGWFCGAPRLSIYDGILKVVSFHLTKNQQNMSKMRTEPVVALPRRLNSVMLVAAATIPSGRRVPRWLRGWRSDARRDVKPEDAHTVRWYYVVKPG